jgi:uncharacterized protein YukE
MAKYVCDFDQVYSIGEKVVSTVTELESSLNTYSSSIDSNLTGWTGDAKSSFSTTNAEQVKTSTADLSFAKELGEFIKSSSKQIQQLEEQLATLTI